MTDRAWFSCLLWHPARNRSGPILTTPDAIWGGSASSGMSNLYCSKIWWRWMWWQMELCNMCRPSAPNCRDRSPL